MESPLKVTGIDHVVLYVSDLAQSKEFYIGLLGMHVAHEGRGQAFLWCGEQQIALFQARDAAEIHAGSEVNHMALRLESGEYADVKAALERAGFPVSGRPGAGSGRVK